VEEPAERAAGKKKKCKKEKGPQRGRRWEDGGETSAGVEGDHRQKSRGGGDDGARGPPGKASPVEEKDRKTWKKIWGGKDSPVWKTFR